MWRIAALSLVALAGQGARESVAEGHVYPLPNGGRIEAVGVCRVEGDGFRCWDLQRRPAPKLREGLAAYYRANPREDLRLTPQKTNRLAMFRLSEDAFLDFGDGTPPPAAQSAREADGEGFRLAWVRVALEPSQKEFEAVVRLNAQQMNPSAELPFERGSKLTYAGVRFEVGDSGPGNFGGGNPPPWRLWEVIVKQTTVDPPAGVFKFEPLDKKGNPIARIDAKGQPTAEGTEGEAVDPQNPRWPVDLRIFSMDRPESLLSNVDPKAIGAIRITLEDRLAVRFRGFPTEP